MLEMSDRKRSQSSPDPTDSDSEGNSSERSSTPLQSRKRPRVSVSPESEAHEQRSKTSNDDRDTERGIRSYTVDIDQDEEELELLATQLIQEKYSFASDEPNVPSEHGILERVECYNFMCHDHFQVELGPLINFIVGKNGSGKSAVLTAITLCLGGKASATNRGLSLKSFIKEGKESATIIVRIKNQGDGAYLPDDFGKSIIVERHFSKNGTSSFKLKSESGRIISTKKTELEAIIDHFTLQFENPMNVLSQDMARQFLSSSSPVEKYKFFVKGVQLEQLDQDYRLIEENGDLIEERILSKQQDLSILKKRRDAAKKKMDLSDQQENLRKEQRHLRHQAAWAQVEEREKIRESLVAEMSGMDRMIVETEGEVEKCDAAIREVEAEAEAAAVYSREASAKVDNAQSEKNDIQTKWTEIMDNRLELQAEQRRIKQHVTEAETRIKEIHQKIDQETQRLADAHGGGFSRMLEELERAKQDASEARRQIDEHEQELQQMYGDVKEAGKKERAAHQPIAQARREFEEAEALLHNLIKEGSGRNSGYPDKMPVLAKAIQQEQSFTEKPVGPIGSLVTLLKPEWSSILESSFGATLNGFIVTSKRDQSILSGIMQRVNCSVPIFIGGGGRLDTSHHEPDQQYDTVLRVLQFDNELVRRQLVINHGIEQNLLIENLEEASSVLFDGEKPNNVKRCYCINQSDRRRGIHLSYNRSGEPNQSPVSVYGGNPRMKSDRDSQIRIQREAVTSLKQVLNDHQEELRSAQSHLTRCKQNCERIERSKTDLFVEIQRKDDHVDELEEALQKEGNQDGDLEILQASLREAQEEKGTHEGSLNDAKNALAEIMQHMKEIKKEQDAKLAEIKKLQEELGVAESEEHMIADKKRKRIHEKNAAIELIEDINRRRDRLRQRRDAADAEVNDYITKASLICERVEINQGETPTSLDYRLEKINRDMANHSRQLGASREEIGAEVGKTEHDYQHAKKQLDDFGLLLQVLKLTLDHRQRRWLHFRSQISSRAKAQFTYLLSERSFRGRLLADHENKTLDLQVEPDITKDSSEGRGARTLSGGEKSFSQVCLLLALWEAMGSPIRCLDEFDVYMDHINRKMAIDMLMYAARRSVGRQFILITPGSRAEISLAPDVMVKELAEPERGQARLSFR
ncbi:hypothetical protein BDW74DRAFT_110880 [Aspergillus multicolor]|uniref:DNA repair protein SMC6 n=1 Tax=Aspergillus multicolor TaxID=41759 RepID=UPI003CCCD1E9